MTEAISQSTLETFVSGKHGWQCLPPHLQKAMAIELMKQREMIRVLYECVGNLLDSEVSG